METADRTMISTKEVDSEFAELVQRLGYTRFDFPQNHRFRVEVVLSAPSRCSHSAAESR
jgi:hypothetical protein